MLVVIGGEAERGKVEAFAQHADEPDGAELTGSQLLDDVTLMGVGQRRVQEGEVDAGGLVDDAKVRAVDRSGRLMLPPEAQEARSIRRSQG